MVRTLGQLISFGMIGIVNTAIDMGVFALLVYRLHAWIIAANIVSFGVGAANSYILNGLVTFGMEGDLLRRSGSLMRFTGVTLAMLVFSTGSVALLAPWLGALAAKGASVILSFLASFMLQRVLVFDQAAVPGRC